MFGITGVTHNEPVPWLTVVFGDWVTVDLVAKARPPLVIIGTVITMIIGGMKEEKHLKKLGKDEGGGLVGISGGNNNGKNHRNALKYNKLF